MQRELDVFTEQQNCHRVRKQLKKVLPSGASADEIYLHPEQFGGEQCGIEVDLGIVDTLLQDAYANGGAELIEYFPDEFDHLANTAFTALDAPTITLANAWDVFKLMLRSMSDTNA